MSVLQERLMQVLSDTGRVAVAQNGLMARLQERWPTPHGYAPQSVDTALKAMRDAGSVHCSPAGKWTRLLDLTKPRVAAAAAPAADPVADETEPLEADNTTQEIEVADKTKVCKGKCGKEKPIGEFYDNCSSCKRCVLDRQRELKAAKNKGIKAVPAVKIPKAKAVAKKNGNASPPADLPPMVRMQYQLVIFDTGGDKHEFMVDLASIRRLQAELKEVA